jgi:hypothetical protein
MKNKQENIQVHTKYDAINTVRQYIGSKQGDRILHFSDGQEM